MIYPLLIDELIEAIFFTLRLCFYANNIKAVHHLSSDIYNTIKNMLITNDKN